MKPIFWSMYLLVGLGVYADQVNFCNDFPEPDPVGCAVSGAIAGLLVASQHWGHDQRGREVTRREAILAKVMKNVKIDEDTGCWVWQGGTSGNGRGGGYPRMSLDGQTVAVHRVMYTNVHGYVPSKKQIDHKCRNRCCVNPDHLEMVTHRENQRRRDNAR